MLLGWDLFASMAGVLVADQAVKALVLSRTELAPLPAGGPPVRIHPSTSRTFAQRVGVRPLALCAVWMVTVVVMVVAAAGGALSNAAARVAVGAALGGAAGNLVDVLGRGGVVDYIRLGWWPAFNLADAAIVAGVTGALLGR